MRHNSILVGVCAVLLTGAVLIPSTVLAQDGQDMTVTVRGISGRVEFRESGGDWQQLVAGYELPLGASISTGFNSNAVLEMGLAVMEVGALTRLTIEELMERDGVVESDLYLEVGNIRADVRRTEDRRADFRLRSPVATAAVRGTSFTFDGRNLEVSQGIVELANLRGRRSTVPAGYQSRVSSDGTAPYSPQQAAQDRVDVVSDTSVRDTEDEGDGARVADDGDTIFDDDLPEISDDFGGIIVIFE